MLDHTASIKVMLSCPSGMEHEVGLAKAVIEKINKKNKINKNSYRLETFYHGDDIVSSFGENPQDQINKKLVDQANIFIGMIYNKFGTPTKKELSGTVEEFKRILDRIDSKEMCTASFFFKDVNMHDVAEDDLIKIVKFKKGISDLGYFKQFADDQAFQNMLELTIENRAEFLMEKSSTPSAGKNISKEELAVVEEEEIGLLELEDLITDTFTESTEFLEVFTASINDLTEDVQLETVKMDAAGESNNKREGRRICEKTAMIMSSFVKNNDKVLNKINQNLYLGTNYLLKYADIYRSDIAPIENQNIDEFKFLKSQMEISQTAMVGFANVVQRLPRLTSSFNKSKRELFEFISTFNSAVGASIDRLGELILMAEPKDNSLIDFTENIPPGDSEISSLDDLI